MLILYVFFTIPNSPWPRISSGISDIKYGVFLRCFPFIVFFELKDDIFLTSSTDTDKYKIIKYNNIIAYMILLIILELNAGQIINLKFDKRFNFYNFLKINDILFENLKIRLNQKG